MHTSRVQRPILRTRISLCSQASAGLTVVYDSPLSQTSCSSHDTKGLLPLEQDRHIGIDRANDSPDVHPIPQRERLARDMCENHLPNDVRKL